jgi:TATA-box binding protein (TBP) (component of TFIID and TFIIIB)
MTVPIASVVPTPYRVSTITCNGNVGTTIHIDDFFQHVIIHDLPDEEEGFVYAEIHGDRRKGIHPNKKKREKQVTSGTPTKCFDNQVTIVYRMPSGYMPNVKLFRNGNLQMTGIRTVEDGHRMIQIMTQEIKRIYENITKTIIVGENIQLLKGDNFTIRMINTDFSVPYKIRRKDLHKLLISSQYNNVCDFQPGTYPGVKLQYFWNDTCSHDGRCLCTVPCFGKGRGIGNGDCKKVTVSVFESGKILITGANEFHQVEEAYAYICNILTTEVEQLRKPEFLIEKK